MRDDEDTQEVWVKGGGIGGDVRTDSGDTISNSLFPDDLDQHPLLPTAVELP